MNPQLQTEKYEIILRQDKLFEASQELAQLTQEEEAKRLILTTIFISTLALLFNLLAW